MPAHLKDPAVRVRRHKATTRTTLAPDHDVIAPELPDIIDWHPLTRQWWDDLWLSPMAPEYMRMDFHGMFRVAMLMNDFWTAETAKQRADIQVRLEKADAEFGTNPLARKRLEWQIEETDSKKASGRRRRQKDDEPAKPPPGEDPRLKLVE